MRHKDSNKPYNFQPSEGQRESLCRNNGSLRCPSLGSRPYIFSDETIQSLGELGEVFKRIRQRLIAEGKITKYENP